MTRPALLAVSGLAIDAPHSEGKNARWRLRLSGPSGKGRTIARARSRAEAEALRVDHARRYPAAATLRVRPGPPGLARQTRRAGCGPQAIFYTIRRLCEAVLHRKVHPHMLRHSFAWRLRENGAALQDIQEALGHAVITTTTMYAHLTTRRRREKLAAFLK
jgi:integrase